jgi:RimJ/RimL family protein N-acetyltransferase
MLKAFVERVGLERYPRATQVVADPGVDNPASIRAFEKAGFYKGNVVDGEDGPEQLMMADLERTPD